MIMIAFIKGSAYKYYKKALENLALSLS